MRKVAWILTLMILAAAMPAVAQDDAKGPITWIAFSKINSGKMEAAVGMAMENKAMMDGLVADGTILSWGLATPINHAPGDQWNYVEWVTVENWAKIDAWAGAVMQHMMSMDADRKAEKEAQGKEIWVEGSHFDEVVRNAVFKVGEGNTRYFYIANFISSDDDDDDDGMTAFFRSKVVPVLDEMVADGTMTAYGVQVGELHRERDWTHRFWYGLPGLGSIDTMTGAFAGAMDAEAMVWAESVFSGKGHYDKVLMVLHSSDNVE
jgi:hypothetical protein